MGPASNVLALIDVARGCECTIGSDLLSILDRICTADYEHVVFDPTVSAALVPQLADLRRRLMNANVTARGLAMVDDAGRSKTQGRVLRRWVTNMDEVVLAANIETSVLLRREDGLVGRQISRASSHEWRTVSFDATFDRRSFMAISAELGNDSSSEGSLGAYVLGVPDMRWLDDAACGDLSFEQLNIFFVEAGRTIASSTVTLCAKCPVRADCLDHAYRHDIFSGYFGGVSPGRRRILSLGEALAEIGHPVRTG